MNRYKQQGFSLIELIIVIVIVAILAAFAAPGFMNTIQKVRTESAQSDLVRMLKEGKRVARSSSTTVSITLDNNVTTGSSLTLAAGSGLNRVETISSGVQFENEIAVIFSALGTVTPPDPDPMFRLVVVNDETAMKRYVDVTASGQIIAHLATFTP